MKDTKQQSSQRKTMVSPGKRNSQIPVNNLMGGGKRQIMEQKSQVDGTKNKPLTEKRTDRGRTYKISM